MTTSELIAELDAAAEGLAGRMTEVDAAVKSLAARYYGLASPVAATVSFAVDPSYRDGSHPNYSGRPAHRRVQLAWLPSIGVAIRKDYADPDGRPVAIGDHMYKPRWEDVAAWASAPREDKLAALARLPELLAGMAAVAAARSEEADAALEALASA